MKEEIGIDIDPTDIDKKIKENHKITIEANWKLKLSKV